MYHIDAFWVASNFPEGQDPLTYGKWKEGTIFSLRTAERKARVLDAESATAPAGELMVLEPVVRFEAPKAQTRTSDKGCSVSDYSSNVPPNSNSNAIANTNAFPPRLRLKLPPPISTDIPLTGADRNPAGPQLLSATNKDADHQNQTLQGSLPPILPIAEHEQRDRNETHTQPPSNHKAMGPDKVPEQPLQQPLSPSKYTQHFHNGLVQNECSLLSYS